MKKRKYEDKDTTLEDNKRYKNLVIMAVVNTIGLIISEGLFLEYAKTQYQYVGWILMFFYLSFEVYAALYYRKSSKALRKKITEQCITFWVDLPLHPYYCLIVYGGICVFTMIAEIYIMLRG